jgi:hypothetical protein
MPFTAAILASILGYVWLIEPVAPRSAVLAPVAAIVVLTVAVRANHSGCLETSPEVPGFKRSRGGRLSACDGT